MSKKNTIALLLLTLLFISGCAQSPMATSFNITTQQQIQSVYHWDVVAEDTAEQLRLSFSTRTSLNGRCVYVEKKDDTIFGEGFRNMLVTKLVNKGMRVLDISDPSALKVSYHVQVVYHKEPLKQPRAGKTALLTAGVLVVREAFDQPWSVPGRIAAVGGALVALDLLTDGFPGYLNPKGPNTEIILTTSVVDNNQYILRKTDCYYVNFSDSWHYNDSQSSQKIKVVN